MPSYFLAETLMYLYLSFDSNNPVLQGRRFLFSTEGHPLPIPPDLHSLYGFGLGTPLISLVDPSNPNDPNGPKL